VLAERGLDPDRILLPSFDESFGLVAGTAQSKGRVAQRINDEALQRDWYNDYAALILRLADRLETTPDGGERRRLIARLQEVLQD
jgi:hypothetical protein